MPIFAYLNCTIGRSGGVQSSTCRQHRQHLLFWIKQFVPPSKQVSNRIKIIFDNIDASAHPMAHSAVISVYLSGYGTSADRIIYTILFFPPMVSAQGICPLGLFLMKYRFRQSQRFYRRACFSYSFLLLNRRTNYKIRPSIALIIT